MIHRVLKLLGTSGAATVELALATPVLATLVVFSVDFGHLLNSAQSIAVATRVGAEYARSNQICKKTATGVNLLPTTTIGATCNNNIQTAMQASRNFSPALTFPVAPQLICYCSGDSAPCIGSNEVIWPPTTNPYSCTTNGRGINQVFIRVRATQTAPTPIIPWPGFPATLSAVTELRIE